MTNNNNVVPDSFAGGQLVRPVPVVLHPVVPAPARLPLTILQGRAALSPLPSHQHPPGSVLYPE